MIGLTAPQLRALRFIAGFRAAHGFAPTMEEIKVGIGVAGRSGVNRIVARLEERGAIARG